jgi:glutamate racemase
MTVTAALSPSSSSQAPIGVFDSGVGGLSVLRHIRALLPDEHLIYVADQGFAPYGGKPEAVLVERSLGIAEFLLEQGVKALVVACNTATVAAIKAVRERHPQLPIVGVEPGLKPAAAQSRAGKIGVMATERTLSGEKFLQLMAQIASASHAEFLLQPCVGLVDLIELGQVDGAATLALLDRYIAPLLAQGADTLVLGCTHYPFVRPAIERLLAQAGKPGVGLIDTGEAVARQLQRLVAKAGLLRQPSPDGAPARLLAYTTADAAALAGAFDTLLGLYPEVIDIADVLV